jgi:hypothetical protein
MIVQSAELKKPEHHLPLIQDGVVNSIPLYDCEDQKSYTKIIILILLYQLLISLFNPLSWVQIINGQMGLMTAINDVIRNGILCVILRLICGTWDRFAQVLSLYAISYEVFVQSVIETFCIPKSRQAYQLSG